MDMTLMPGKMAPLKVDVKGREWTPAEKREEILREFDRSGASGVEFARMIGVKYPTFAGWIRRRGTGEHAPAWPHRHGVARGNAR